MDNSGSDLVNPLEARVDDSEETTARLLPPPPLCQLNPQKCYRMLQF